MTGGRYEVWFESDDTVSVVVETDAEAGAIAEREMLETAVFAGLAAGIIANLPKDAKRTLCSRLADFDLPSNRDEIPTSVEGRSLVLPSADRNRKGFEGAFTMKGTTPIGRMKSRGFGLFGREVQDYAQTAVQAVLLHLLLGFTSDGRVMLAETAHTLGTLGLSGAVGMTTHPHAAMAALEAGISAVESD